MECIDCCFNDKTIKKKDEGILKSAERSHAKVRVKIGDSII